MAASGERRLLFDTRGKRKHVIRVVYAILALLMGTSLFLVIGPVNIGELIGNSTTSSTAAKVLEEQVERIEGRLAKNPDDDQLLLTLTRAHINAGDAQIEPTAETEVPVLTLAVREQFGAASETWPRYLKQAGDEPSASGALLVAGMYFRLAEASSTTPEVTENLDQAVKAQRIVAEQRPSVGSLSSLAIYQYFAGDFAAGDKTTRQVAAKTGSKAEAQSVEKQLAQYRERGKQLAKRKTEFEKAQQEAGKEALQNPFSGLGGAPGG